MLSPIKSLDQAGDRIKLETWAQTEVGWDDRKARDGRGVTSIETDSKGIVDDRPEWATGCLGSLAQARRDVVIQGERGPLRHIMKPNPLAS